MNRRKWGRMLGVAAGAPEMPVAQLHALLDYLARSPASGGVGNGTAKSYHGCLFVNPPAGGFASGDILHQFPHTDNDATTAAVVVPDLTRNFAPGHYRISGWIQAGGTMVSNTGIGLMFFNADPDRGWAIEGSAAPCIGYRATTASGSLFAPAHFDTEMYLAGLWYIQVRAMGNLTDPQAFSVHLSVAPLMLLDDFPSAR